MITFSGRIPIHIFPVFWILIFLIGWINTSTLLGTAIWAVVIFISVLLHEFGHACTALVCGQEAEISLVAFGGVTQRSGAPLKKWQEFLVVLNGPLVGFLLAIVCFFLLGSHALHKWPYLQYALTVAVNVNIAWTILNLLPILPLDGGHLSRIALGALFGLTGTKASILLSIVFAAVFCVISFALLGQFILGAIFLMLAFESYRSWTDFKTLSVSDTNEDLQQRLKDAQADFTAGRMGDAESKFQSLIDETKSGVLHITATYYLANLLYLKHNYKLAYERLAPLRKELSTDALRLLQRLAFLLAHWQEVVNIGNEIFKTMPNHEVAVANAFAHAIMGHATPAVEWLRSAKQQGYVLPDSALQGREFDAIRHTPVFESWLKSK